MNLRILATFTLLLLMLSTGARAQDAEETYGLRNGRFWNTLTDEEQNFLLIGIHEGWQLRGNTESVVQGSVILALGQCAAPVRYGEYREMITTAYKEPENRSLPIGWVMMADEAIRCGQTTADVVFPALRKFLAGFYGKEVSSPGLSPISVIASVSK